MLRRKVQAALLAWGLALLAGGCATPALAPPHAAPTVPETPAFVTAPIQEAALQLVAAERQAAIDRDLNTLAQLWAPDSRVVDARGTGTPEDDLVWPGKAAVLDRYVVAVFPNPPPPLGGLVDATVDVDGESAVLDLGSDRWRFVFADGRWWLAELTYGLP